LVFSKVTTGITRYVFAHRRQQYSFAVDTTYLQYPQSGYHNDDLAPRTGNTRLSLKILLRDLTSKLVRIEDFVPDKDTTFKNTMSWFICKDVAQTQDSKAQPGVANSRRFTIIVMRHAFMLFKAEPLSFPSRAEPSTPLHNIWFDAVCPENISRAVLPLSMTRIKRHKMGMSAFRKLVCEGPNPALSTATLFKYYPGPTPHHATQPELSHVQQSSSSATGNDKKHSSTDIDREDTPAAKRNKASVLGEDSARANSNELDDMQVLVAENSRPKLINEQQAARLEAADKKIKAAEDAAQAAEEKVGAFASECEEVKVERDRQAARLQQIEALFKSS